MSNQPPKSSIDLWSDLSLLDPFPHYRALRDLAPVVHLEQHDLYAVTRYADVRRVLEDWQRFSSAKGVGFNEHVNQVMAGSLVGSDPPRHRHYRSILERPLSMADLKVVRERVKDLARGQVTRLVEQGSVEIVTELASYLPVCLVAELVGLPPEGRERMLEWAAGAFNSLAPIGVPRVEQGISTVAQVQDYCADPTLPERVRPGSWAARLHDVVRSGELMPDEFATLLSVNYVLPALDTTIHATANMIWLLAQDERRWAELRDNRAMTGRAVHESLRLEGPVQAFSRMVTEDTDVGGYEVKSGQRLLVCFAAANRDERHYPDPDSFDMTRSATDHVAFGYSEHVCLGRNLALLELTLLLTELLDQVQAINIVETERGVNNGIRGFRKLRVELQRAH